MWKEIVWLHIKWRAPSRTNVSTWFGVFGLLPVCYQAVRKHTQCYGPPGLPISYFLSKFLRRIHTRHTHTTYTHDTDQADICCTVSVEQLEGAQVSSGTSVCFCMRVCVCVSVCEWRCSAGCVRMPLFAFQFFLAELLLSTQPGNSSSRWLGKSLFTRSKDYFWVPELHNVFSHFQCLPWHQTTRCAAGTCVGVVFFCLCLPVRPLFDIHLPLSPWLSSLIRDSTVWEACWCKATSYGDLTFASVTPSWGR